MPNENGKSEPLGRVVHRYTVPKEVGGEKYQSVGLVELRAGEEIAATKRARNDAVRLAFEMAKQCLVEVNGDKVGLADHSVDKAWEEMPPKIRNLVMAAYAELHSPPEAAADAFLASRRSETG